MQQVVRYAKGVAKDPKYIVFYTTFSASPVKINYVAIIWRSEYINYEINVCHVKVYIKTERAKWTKLKFAFICPDVGTSVRVVFFLICTKYVTIFFVVNNFEFESFHQQRRHLPIDLYSILILIYSVYNENPLA